MNSGLISSWITSSQKRVFMGDVERESELFFSTLKNEPVSFFAAYRTNGEKDSTGKDTNTPLSIRIEAEGLPVSIYKVAHVPFAASECEDASPTAIGSTPEILIKKNPTPALMRLRGMWDLNMTETDDPVTVNSSATLTNSVYITVNEDGETLEAGEYTVSLIITALVTGEVVARHDVKIKVINASLPENDLIYTNWFHYDCFSESTGLRIFSDEYFSLLGRFFENAVRHGMTAILTPAFTPSLDTPLNYQRTPTQLVGVKEKNGEFSFDLSLLERFILLAKKCGFKYIEHCHLFSQWGATFAIDIYGERDGEFSRIFDRSVSATDPRYTKFLNSYLKEFLALADKLGVRKDLVFHISDEPTKKNIATYSAALASVADVLSDEVLGDALSDYQIFEEGYVKMPIVDVEKADDFLGRCDNMMLYYTGGEPHPGLTNRRISSSPWRTRALGVQMYYYKSKGFLHWGYNFNYGEMCQGYFDPSYEPNFYKNIPGITYLVYYGKGGAPMPSLREERMREAMNDCLALRLLEGYIGRERVLEICSEVLSQKIDFLAIPHTAENMIALRERINAEIEKAASTTVK